MTKPALAVDLGGTRIKLGVVNDGRLLARSVLEAQSDKALETRLPSIASQLRQLLSRVGVSLSECAGIAFGYPSLISVGGDRVLTHSGKYPDALSLNLARWCRATFGLPCYIENDARAALLGEWQYGVGTQGASSDLVMITLGTGIGTAVVSENRPLRGIGGDAGNFGGHMMYDRNMDITCHCGLTGCYESCLGSWSLPQRAIRTPGFAESTLAHVDEIDYERVFREANRGDHVATLLRDGAVAGWSDLVIALIRSFSPSMVILGGGIMASADVILPRIQESVARVAQIPSQAPPVVAASLGNDAGLAGLGWLAQQHRHAKTNTPSVTGGLHETYPDV